MRGAGPDITTAVAPVDDIFEMAAVMGWSGYGLCRSDEAVPSADPSAALVTVEPLDSSVSAGFGRPARVRVLRPRLVRLVLPDLSGFPSFFLLGEVLLGSLHHRRISDVTLVSGESGLVQSLAEHLKESFESPRLVQPSAECPDGLPVRRTLLLETGEHASADPVRKRDFRRLLRGAVQIGEQNLEHLHRITGRRPAQ